MPSDLFVCLCLCILCCFLFFLDFVDCYLTVCQVGRWQILTFSQHERPLRLGALGSLSADVWTQLRERQHLTRPALPHLRALAPHRPLRHAPPSYRGHNHTRPFQLVSGVQIKKHRLPQLNSSRRSIQVRHCVLFMILAMFLQESRPGRDHWQLINYLIERHDETLARLLIDKMSLNWL